MIAVLIVTNGKNNDIDEDGTTEAKILIKEEPW